MDSIMNFLPDLTTMAVQISVANTLSMLPVDEVNFEPIC